MATQDEMDQYEEQMQLDQLEEDYKFHAKRMQTGVATMMQWSTECDPKHLRVGVNSAMVTDKGLAELLIEKGIITKVEYFTAMRDAMKAEADEYERLVQEKLGPIVKLGGL